MVPNGPIYFLKLTIFIFYPDLGFVRQQNWVAVLDFGCLKGLNHLLSVLNVFFIPQNICFDTLFVFLASIFWTL